MKSKGRVTWGILLGIIYMILTILLFVAVILEWPAVQWLSDFLNGF